MKAFLVLAAIYVGAFLIAIQGASQTQAEGIANKPGVQRVDPAKDADIRSLMELVGARRMAQDASRLRRSSTGSARIWSQPCRPVRQGQRFVNAFVRRCAWALATSATQTLEARGRLGDEGHVFVVGRPVRRGKPHALGQHDRMGRAGVHVFKGQRGEPVHPDLGRAVGARADAETRVPQDRLGEVRHRRQGSRVPKMARRRRSWLRVTLGVGSASIIAGIGAGGMW